MEAIFSKEIQAGLDQARIDAMKKSSRLRVQVDGDIHPVLHMWKSGFALPSDAPALRGRVDLYDGAVHLFQCLIITSSDEAGERRYEFKRATAVSDAPAVDFEIDEEAPAGLIEDAR
ncbi:hypothetical protein [uncultured Roseobacter sp.]|uniref:hypothetical protein n=1 Tax=uncultured Roseobacter sp. TaxID=114847 RepID=UPI00260C0B8A|nr:hypothetical protein [uncultured Roseobacter sp.]